MQMDDNFVGHGKFSASSACSWQVYGPESSGKTTLALHAMAEVQKAGGTAALIDAEHAFDSAYSKVAFTCSMTAISVTFWRVDSYQMNVTLRHLGELAWVMQNMGLDVEKILLCQPDNGEMALEVVDQLVRSNAVDIIAIDSVAALVPRAEIEGEIGAVQGASSPCQMQPSPLQQCILLSSTAYCFCMHLTVVSFLYSGCTGSVDEPGAQENSWECIQVQLHSHLPQSTAA